MKATLMQKGSSTIELVDFDGLEDFYGYVTTTPFNQVFAKASDQHSITNGQYFTGTPTFEAAVELLKNGWSTMAATLTQRLKELDGKRQTLSGRKSVLDVCGYQPVVPLYLNNVPTNMVNRKSVPMKDKVITINKSIDYPSSASTDTIMEESVKALQIVKKLEAIGYKVNINIVLGSKHERAFFIRVRIKNASERLNISKLAFVLVHPSMLRRLFFRFIEVHPTITNGFKHGYGRPSTAGEIRTMLSPKEYLIPAFVKKDINTINTLDDLESL